MAEENEKPKTFLKFKASQKSPTLDIMAGEYRRMFKVDEQPFQVADAEEEQLLRNTGFFVSDKEAQAEADAEAKQAEGAAQEPAKPEEGANATENLEPPTTVATGLAASKASRSQPAGDSRQQS